LPAFTKYATINAAIAEVQLYNIMSSGLRCLTGALLLLLLLLLLLRPPSARHRPRR
jgi:hypothetical protein